MTVMMPLLCFAPMRSCVASKLSKVALNLSVTSTKGSSVLSQCESMYKARIGIKSPLQLF